MTTAIETPPTTEPPKAKRKTNEQAVADLRAVAQNLGSESLSWKRYNDGREQGMVHSHGLIRRFGTWSAACEAAGVSPGPARRQTYVRAFSDDEMLALVREFLDGGGSTYADFTAWCSARKGGPSAGHIRNTFGTWSAAKTAALA